MMPARWTIAVSICILTAPIAGAVGQTEAAAASPRSTRSGVYTAEQAARGKDVYAGSCHSCHVPESHTGATFAKWWRGKQLSDLFAYVSQRMPKNDPGSLAPEDYADVVAYLLRMNAMPVGTEELAPDLAALKDIRIELKTKSATVPQKKSGSTVSPPSRKKP